MEWIKITDRLPDYGVEVTVYDHGKQKQAIRTKTDRQGDHWWEDSNCLDVEPAHCTYTHWHPQIADPK